MVFVYHVAMTQVNWDEFGTEEYAWRCYGRIMDVDQMLIKGVIQALKRLELQPASLQRVTDVGCGPNLFPSMLLAPFVLPKQQGGQLELIEYSQPNLVYLRDVLSGRPASPPISIWERFETFMGGCGSTWLHALDDLKRVATVEYGDVYALQPRTYDAISAFFVPESITDSLEECKKAMASLLAAVKPGGVVIIGHMLGSVGYPAGEGKIFPGVSLTVDDLRQFYTDELENMTIIEPPLTSEVHSDYHGAAVVVGIKSQKSKVSLSVADDKAFTAYDTQTCLYDQQRVRYLQQAIFDTVHPGDIVVDAGSGTGVLGMIAAQAGASKVYCIELNQEYAEVIRYNAANNGMQDKIVVIQGDATTIALPEQVDVIVSEVISTGFFYEPQLQILHNMRRFLKKGGRVVPEAMENFVELIDAQEELYGLRFNYDSRYRELNDTSLTTKGKYLSTTFLQDTSFSIAATTKLRCMTTGRANAVRISCAIRFSSGVLATEPTDFLLNPQIIFLPEPRLLQVGKYYDLSLRYEASDFPVRCKITIQSSSS